MTPCATGLPRFHPGPAGPRISYGPDHRDSSPEPAGFWARMGRGATMSRPPTTIDILAWTGILLVLVLAGLGVYCLVVCF